MLFAPKSEEEGWQNRARAVKINDTPILRPCGHPTGKNITMKRITTKETTALLSSLIFFHHSIHFPVFYSFIFALFSPSSLPQPSDLCVPPLSKSISS